MLKRIEVGSKVTLKNLEKDQILNVTIVYQKKKSKPIGGTGAYYDMREKEEVVLNKFDKTIISDETEMGRKLLGKSIGELVTVAKHKYEILDIN